MVAVQSYCGQRGTRETPASASPESITASIAHHPDVGVHALQEVRLHPANHQVEARIGELDRLDAVSWLQARVEPGEHAASGIVDQRNAGRSARGGSHQRRIDILRCLPRRYQKIDGRGLSLVITKAASSGRAAANGGDTFTARSWASSLSLRESSDNPRLKFS